MRRALLLSRNKGGCIVNISNYHSYITVIITAVTYYYGHYASASVCARRWPPIPAPLTVLWREMTRGVGEMEGATLMGRDFNYFRALVTPFGEKRGGMRKKLTGLARSCTARCFLWRCASMLIPPDSACLPAARPQRPCRKGMHFAAGGASNA